MFTSDHENGKQREAFIKAWRFAEKRLERFGGVLALFAAGLVMAVDRPGDQYSAMAVAAFIAGGLLLLLRSRRPASQRAHLYFLSPQRQSSWATSAGFAAVFCLYQAWRLQRPLLLIVAAGLGIVAGWFQWRARKLQQYATLFPQDEADHASETGAKTD